ncbi:major facilitator superfamily transporter [Fusarium beomiforme]|uniref:Major facilitator superfamily transporter n=1 Tax=Fusarium beomiforme TaxID=44412 RepID=A0A9P5DR35_9HYPO|nr:major facilitator superfamily transporter [Fusarium beomiforme]
MAPIHRIFSSANNKPYRTKQLEEENPPYLSEDGYVEFAPGDIQNPQNWSSARRWTVTFSAVLLVLNATFASSSPSGCFPSISEHFHVSELVAGLTITLFLLDGSSISPLHSISFSTFFVPGHLIFGALLVGRFLTGTFVSAPLSNAPGVLADLWTPLERGNAMAGFSAMVWVGPALGPVIAGFLELKKDWRWSFYVLLWLGGATALVMLTIPETHAPTLLLKKARRIRKAKIPGYENVKARSEESDRTLKTVYRIALTRPWIILFDTISFLCAVYMSVVYTLLYMLFSIYPIVFQQHRGWNPGVGELPLIGTVIGAFIGGGIVLIDTQIRKKKIEQGGKQIEPEDRLPLAMIGGVGFAVTMFWFAWTAEYNSIHWIVPTLAGTFLATSLMLIFVAYLTYLVDVYLMYAASAIAANTIARSACGAAAPLFTTQMFDVLGVGGGGSLIGGVATVLAIIPFLFYRYGKQIRIRSKFAPTEGKREAKEKDEEYGDSNTAARRNSVLSHSDSPNSSDSTVAAT